MRDRSSCVAVRQAPLTAMLPPTCTSSRGTAPVSTQQRHVAAARLNRTNATHALHDPGEHQSCSLRRGRSVSRRSSPIRSHVAPGEFAAVAHPLQRRHVEQAARRAAEHHRRHVDHDFIRQPGTQERARQRRPGLDQHLVALERRESRQHGREVEPALAGRHGLDRARPTRAAARRASTPRRG